MLRTVEKYEIYEEIGHGGMATVSRARDSHLDRWVALKVLHPHLRGSDEARNRFRREARSVAKLRHPNIIEIYDYSGEDSTESFIATELLTGPTLKEFVTSQHDIPAEIAACFGIELAQALDAAHRAGIIHRDVKPENAILHDRRSIKLTDFGIAQLVDAQSFTATGQVLGSPGHMAPEQLSGRECDVRTDVFSLGTLVYYVATGTLPFEGKTPHEILRKVAEADYRDPLIAQPSIGAELARILRKVLARRPEDRYQSAREFEDALRAFVATTTDEPPDKLLTRYLQSPDDVAAEVRRRAIETLLADAEKDVKKRDVPGSYERLNRVLALDEKNTRAVALAHNLGRRRRLRRLVSVGGWLTLTAAAAALLVWALSNPNADTPTNSATQAGGAAAAQASSEKEPLGASLDRDIETTQAGPSAAGEDRTLEAASKAQGGSPRAASAQEPRIVRFRPRPANLTIEIDDGAPRSFGPSFHQVSLEPGRHRFRFVGGADCCEPKEIRMWVPPGPGTTILPVELTYRPARAYVIGNVPANVTITKGPERRAEGRTREILQVPMDKLEEILPLRVSAPGFQDFGGNVRLRAGRVTELNVVLEPTEGPSE